MVQDKILEMELTQVYQQELQVVELVRYKVEMVI
jgi:hypothetical protein